jgi:hypothetical protein
MPAPIPRPGPDEEQPPGGALGPGGEQQSAAGWAWVEGSADTGPVPRCERPGPQPWPAGAGGLPAGLDYAALVEGLAASGALGSDADDQDAEFAEWQAAEAEGRLQPADPAQVAAQAVEHMPPGAAQAAWLEVAAGGVDRLDEYGLVGVTLAAGAQEARAAATKLSAVARLCAATAAADPRIGLRAGGRPARVSRDAVGQIEMALRLTHYQAEDLADLAVTLAWRLPATGRALAAGVIDLDRAKLIAQATSVLSEEQARAVEKKILPAAGGLTRPFLRDRLARAVINADPSGAEKRREQAERQAKVGLYGDPDGTATLAGSNLPAVHAAAAMARITAIARAMKAAGQVGGLNFHRAQVMLGLLLGTLPPIPPAEGAPPDQPSPDDVDPSAADEGPSPADDGGAGRPTDTGDGPSGGGSRHDGPDGCDPDDRGHHDGGEHDNRRWDDLPAPRDEDAPPDDGLDDNGPGPQDRSWDPAEEDDDISGTVRAWPALGAIPPALARRPAGPSDGRPVAELLDALLPWTTLAGLTDVPGTLGRIGPITAAQARLLAQAAQADPAAQWRVIVTNPAGQAIAVTRIRRPRRRGRDQAGPDACRDGPAAGVGLVGRITVTVTEDTVTAPGWQAGRPRGGGPPARAGPAAPIAVAALRAAARALEQARVQAREDQAAGGCAHRDESPAYRPPSRLREYVIARDVTCRSPVCRQPAWRADLDHTRPWAPGGQGGRTCGCNLGGRCRRDHQLKQNPRWRFEQTGHGVFRWTTPAGQTYEVSPDPYPV